MVLRSTRPKGVAGVVRDQAARTDDLARRQGRGAQALRNRAGHILELNPASPNPLVTPQGTDSALRFQDGMLVVTDGDGENTRDMTVRSMRTSELLITNNAIKCIPYDGALRFSSLDGALEVANRDGSQLRGIRTNRLHANDIDSNGDINALGGMRAEAGLSCGGDFVVGARARATNWSASNRDGAIRWAGGAYEGALEVVNYAGTQYRGVFASNFAPPPSWRAYKTDQRPLAEFLGAQPGEVIDRLDLEHSWTYDPETQSFDDGTEERIGLKLDELPEPLRLARVDDDTGEDRSTYDLAGLLTVALAELQSLRARVAELEATR